MTAYELAVRDFKITLVLQTVFQFNGHFGAAAQCLGVHRNLVTRVLRNAGYSAHRVRKMVHRHHSVRRAMPPQPERVAAIERRRA
jgi:hypothetical protein